MVMKAPKVPEPKRGPLPPTSASADPGGASLAARRNFLLSGVSTTPQGVAFNPNLAQRGNGSRAQTGGST